MRRFIPFIIGLFSVATGFSQIPDADFSLPEMVCKGENIILSNSSTNANSYAWDFCETDLQAAPVASTLTEQEFLIPIGASLIEVNGQWYGFITNLNNNSIFRVDFGTSLLNPTPSVVNLGNLGELINAPQDVKAVASEGNYYLFVNNRGTNNELIRINLGSNIEATMASSDVLLAGRGFTNGGLDVAFDGTNWVVFVTKANRLTRVVLGNSLGDIPTSSDIQETATIPDVNGIGDIKLVEDNNQWYGFVVGFNSKTVHRLDFNSNLLQNPVPTQLNTAEMTGVSPYGLTLEKDDNRWILFSSTNEGDFLRLDLGEDITNDIPAYTNLGRLGQLRRVLKFDMAKSNSRWVGLATDWNSKKYFLLNFPRPDCSFNRVSSTNADTVQLTAPESGTFSVSLEARGENGLTASITKTITVSDTKAPAIAIINNVCLQGGPTQFTVQTNQPLTSATWTINNENRFGETVTYDFPTPGTYSVTLEVESDNGCGNRLTQEITIYEPPAPAFTAPAGLICTNNPVRFTNTTDAKGADVDSLITYRWFVDDELVSEVAEPDITFAEGGERKVRLEASIPGCTEVTEQIISVLPGPVVRFDVAQVCEGRAVTFTNQTTGEGITGYTWDFGDGGSFTSTTAESPSYTFDEPGTYPVSLSVTNELGCQNVYRQEVTVYEQPSVGFVSEVACVGTPTQFTDTTTAGTNANVIEWAWSFGDGGTANERNPAHTYSQPGTYEVQLITQTTAGCVDSAVQTVTVESPVAAGFVATAQCPTASADYRVLLSDTSIVAAGDNVNRWFWSIGSASFVTQNVEYSFPGPGTYPVTLTAFAASGCASTVTRSVIVDSLPAVAFTHPVACTGEPVVFQSEVSAGLTDYRWSFGEVGTAFAANPSFVFDAPGTYAVTLRAQTPAGCPVTTTQSVTVMAAPVAAFEASATQGGAPLSVTFTNQSTNATQYAWDVVGVEPSEQPTSEEANPTFTFDEVGTYAVMLTATNAAGCVSTVAQTITVRDPVQDIRLEEISVVDNPRGAGQRLLLSVRNAGSLPVGRVAIVIGFGDAVSVQEDLPQPLLAGETRVYVTQFILPKTPGSVRYLCATLTIDDADFVDISPEDNRNCVSLDERLSTEAPFPNPVRDQLQLPVILPQGDAVSLRLIDSRGQTMRTYRQANAPAGLNTFVIPTKGLPVGTYLLQITSRGEQRQWRVGVAP